MSGVGVAGGKTAGLAAGERATASPPAAARAARPFLSDAEIWETSGGRAVGRIACDGAEIGECRAAIEAVDDGGTDEW